jgi:predicted nucleic acid-binding protein
MTRPTLVDSNVILDILLEDPQWYEWSSLQLMHWVSHSTLVINPLIYAEITVGFKNIEEVEDAVPPAFFRREPLPWEAAFLAGKCFLQYRKQRGGQKRSPMPDFYIGAHALVRGYRLLTRDSPRFRTYFPALELIAPEAAP